MFFPFDNAINNLSGYSDILSDSPSYYVKEVYCKNCGTSLSDFIDTGFVGCAKCYKEFKDSAIELAQNVHGRTNHVGKAPKGSASKNAKLREIEWLEKEKEKAAASEQYLRAADLKKQIDRLKGELK